MMSGTHKPCDKGKEPEVVAAAAAGNCTPYPKPLANYKDVVDNRELFMGTLEKLHAAMETKFMVPTIGGRELDLHRLFVEVTSRGGIVKVIECRRWREVTAAFSFPSTATNASFVLRKYYMSLLHHYEQIYFFGSQGWVAPPTVSLRPSAATSAPPPRLVEPMINETQVAGQKRRRNNAESASAGLSLSTDREVVGVIDGKFEHGYFITVTIGTQKLRGVLYPAPEQTAVQSGIAENANVTGGVRRRRRRKKLSKLDPTHPKPNRSGYNFFFSEQHARLKALHPGKDREISKMIGDLWNKLTETEKSVYQEKGVKDKERYKSEMVLYREKQKMGPIISNAVPIQQRPAEPEPTIEDVDSKLELDEGDLPSSNQNESSSEGSDSEEKMSGGESETETSSELGGTPAESRLVAEPSAEGDGFEQEKRDTVKMENKTDLPSSSEDTV